MTDIVIRQGNRAQWLRVLGAAALRALRACVQFWNIPALGDVDARDSRYLRTGL